MSRLQEVAVQKQSMNTIVKLTGAFEGLASMRIAQVKNQVLQSQEFFQELWQIYTQIRVGQQFHYGRTSGQKTNSKHLFIVVTSEGGLSGDIDQKLIKWMLSQYHPDQQDIIVIGHHGAMQLIQSKVQFKKYFAMPKGDRSINVAPLVQEVQQYSGTTVFYQAYSSLMVQDVKSIEIQTAVAEQGKKVAKDEDFISERTYIFEPSTHDVVAYLEGSMVQIALSQVILDSKLAQYASRFRAMTMANDKADELYSGLNDHYNRVKRRTQDERLKEIANGLRKIGART